MGVRVWLFVVAAGVVAGELAATAIPLRVALAVMVAAAGAWWRTRRWPSRHLPLAALGACAAAIGVVRMQPVVAPRLDASHVARLALPLRTTLEARVVAPPQHRPGETVLLVAAERVAGRRATGRIRLTLRGADSRWRHGDRVRVLTTLRRPRNFANPGGFDYVGHLARRGVGVTAFVWDAATAARLPARRVTVRAQLEAWRARIGARIEATVAAPAAAVLMALVIGRDDAIPSDLREAFARAGVVHVLSVSGLHIGLVAVAAFAATRWLFSRSERVLLALDVTRVAGVASLGPVLVYSALAGFEIATLRSALMAAMLVLAGLLGRRAGVLRTLALAALVLALASPGAPLEVSFQLSFVSVLAIALGVGGRGRHRAGWIARAQLAFRVAVAALHGTAPLTAFHFHQVSLIGVVANPLVVPIFGGVVVVPGLLGALVEPLAPALADGLFALAGMLLRPGLGLVRLLAAPRWAAVDVPMPSLGELLLLYALIGTLVLRPRRPPARVLATIVVVALLADAAWWVHERWGSGWLRVTFLDVGQGDAAVAELPDGRVIVVDGGGFPGSEFDTGAAVVSPFLWRRKIRRLDAIALTHAHPDHAAGLPFLIARHHPREFWWTGHGWAGRDWQRLTEALDAARETRIRVLDSGSAVPGFANAVRVLHPPAGWAARPLNDTSLVLQLAHGRTRFLLTGDLEAGGEHRLIVAGGALESPVVKVPHHGSRTSSTGEFLAAIQPRLAVISVGQDNRYGLPAPEVEARYRALGACVLRTDRCGAVSIASDGTVLRVRAVRPGCRCPAGVEGVAH